MRATIRSLSLSPLSPLRRVCCPSADHAPVHGSSGKSLQGTIDVQKSDNYQSDEEERDDLPASFTTAPAAAALVAEEDEADEETESATCGRKRKRKARKIGSRKAKGGSGAMEGDQELDYEVVKRNCMPVPFCADAQFEEHKKALVVDIPPPKILYTDEASCALDAYNMGANPTSPITRAELAGDGLGSITSAVPALPLGAGGEPPSTFPSSPSEGGSVGSGVVEPKAVNLGHARMVKAMKERGHVLEPIGSKSAPPKLQRVLKQTRGIYLVEFHWFNKEGERNHHVIAVNCTLRLVFCNTLGALPFTLADKVGKWNERETVATHDNVARRFHIQSVTRVWRVLRKA